MTIAVLILATVATLILLLPAFSDLWSLVALMWSRPHRRSEAAEPPRLLFLVPAHNEEVLIASCIRSIRAQHYPAEGRRIVVLADNCTDRTADISREAGALTLERDAPTAPGKTQALGWAFARLPLEHYDAVVIVDADVVLDPGFAAALTRYAPLSDRIVQPYNDVRNPGDNALTRLAALYAAVLFRVAFRLKARAGLNIPLSAGMCIGTNVLRRHGWTAQSICEDWELYASSTAHGVPIALAPEARIAAHEEHNLRSSGTQRQRWLAGKVAVARAWVPTLATSRTIGVRQALDAVAELLAPGPVVHLATVAILIALVLPLAPTPGSRIITILLGLSLCRTGLYAVLALRSDQHPMRTLRAFAFLPRYALWRVGVVLRSAKLLGSGAWVRTDRRESIHAP